MKSPEANKPLAFGLSISFLFLAACTVEPGTTDVTGPVALQGAAAGPESPENTINWTGRGQEPFWSLNIIGLETKFGQPGAGYSRTADSIVIQSPGVGETVAKFISNGAPYLIVTRTEELCIDEAKGAPFPYALVVQSGEQLHSGCGGSTEEFLSSRDWVVEDIDGKGAVDGGEPRITFEIDGSVTLNSICREILGKYIVRGSELTFEFEPVDDRGCKPDALKVQEVLMLDVT